MGMHVSTHTFIDPEALLEEITQSADLLTHGLVCKYEMSERVDLLTHRHIHKGVRGELTHGYARTLP